MIKKIIFLYSFILNILYSIKFKININNTIVRGTDN